MSTTPNLALELVPSDSFQPWTSINDTLQLIDALLQLAIVDRGLTTPPATVAGDAGKRWIIGGSPSGAWAGQGGNIALCTGANLWRFIAPKEGFLAWVIDEAAEYRYTSGAWAIVT